MLNYAPNTDVFDLNENYEMIDIAIQKADKYLTSKKRIQEFLDNPVKVYEKLDGIKVNLYHIDKTGIPEKDWIVSYKNQIIYSKEFEYLSDIQIKNSSINNSQFKFIFDQLKTIDSKSIPKNYEFFIEYLMKKPTLSSNYNVNHQMILLACSPSKIEFDMGRVKSKGSFDISKREEFAKKLGIDTPPFIFDGRLRDFENGCKNPKLLDLYNQNKFQIHNDETMVSTLTDIFLQLNSKYGNTPEGYVLDFGNLILKIQQPYQVDQNARNEIKNQYRMTPDDENRYWNQVRLQALTIVNKLKRPFKAINLNDILGQAAQEIKKIPNSDVPTHQKKNKVQVLDDIQGNIKMIIIKQLQGNNNALFLGKMRILTKAHYDIINKASKAYDKLVVCLVTGSDTKFSQKIRMKMLKTAFGDNPKIEIIEHSNGNLFSIMNKASCNINVVLCGTDRLNDYKNMLSKNPDIKVMETQRPSGAVSATFVIKNLSNEMIFKSNTPKEIRGMYNEILKFYKKNTPDDIDMNESADNYVYYDDTEEYVTRIFEKHSFKNINIDELFSTELDENYGLMRELDELRNLIEQKSREDHILNEAYDERPSDLNQLKERINGKKNAATVQAVYEAASHLNIPFDDICLDLKGNSAKMQVRGRHFKALVDKINSLSNLSKIKINSKDSIDTMMSGERISLNIKVGNGSGNKPSDALVTKYGELGSAIIAVLRYQSNKKIRFDAETIYNILSYNYENTIKTKEADVNEIVKEIADYMADNPSWLSSIILTGNVLGRLLIESNKQWTIHRASSEFNAILEKGKELSGLQNSWNPADLILIESGFNVSSYINDANIKDIFDYNMKLAGNGKSYKSLFNLPIVSVSLKKSDDGARHGQVSLDNFQKYTSGLKQYNIKFSEFDDNFKLFFREQLTLLASNFGGVAQAKFKNKTESLDQVWEDIKASKISRDWFKSWPVAIEFLNDCGSIESVEGKLRDAWLFASNKEIRCCPHLKIMGGSKPLYVGPAEQDFVFNLKNLIISLNGNMDVVALVNAGETNYKMQIRSNGTKPQFFVSKEGVNDSLPALPKNFS